MKRFLVSPGGDAPERFGTIQQALQAIRELPRPWTGDVVVDLEPAVYRLTEPIEIGPDDGGRDGHTLAIRTRPGGGRAVLDGTHLVEGWQPAGRGRWRAPVGDRRFGSLFVDGARCVQARWPVDGYARGLEYDPDAPRRRMRIAAAELPPIADPNALQVFVWPGGESGEWNWFSELTAVEDLDRVGGMLTLAGDGRYPLGPGTRFFLTGAVEFLDLPAAEPRYALDRGAGEVLLHLGGEIAGHEVSTAAVSALVSIRGCSAGPAVSDVRLENLVLRGCDDPHEVPDGTGPPSARTPSASPWRVARSRPPACTASTSTAQTARSRWPPAGCTTSATPACRPTLPG